MAGGLQIVHVFIVFFLRKCVKNNNFLNCTTGISFLVNVASHHASSPVIRPHPVESMSKM